MANQIAIILQNPLTIVISFKTDGNLAPRFHLKIDFVTDGLILTGIGSGADEEVIGKAGDLSKVEDDQI